MLAAGREVPAGDGAVDAADPGARSRAHRQPVALGDVPRVDRRSGLDGAVNVFPGQIEVSQLVAGEHRRIRVHVAAFSKQLEQLRGVGRGTRRHALGGADDRPRRRLARCSR